MWARSPGKIDAGRSSDWSGAAEDYARYRPDPPPSLFARLAALGIGLPGQRILDIATGTGALARHFAASGAEVCATDLSEEQIGMGARLPHGAHVDFRVAPAEAQPFADHSFDAVTVCQAWMYFDVERVLGEVRRLVRPGGSLVICHFSFLPRLDPIVAASEALVLDHNPDWSGADWDGVTRIMRDLAEDIRLRGMFWYDEPIPFDRESWRGRMRALRGIAASLSSGQVAAFDADHAALLERIAAERFDILHRVDAHIFDVGPEGPAVTL